jgi:hypothetical protein
MISPVRLIPPSLGAGGVAASPGSAAPAAAKGSHMGATGVAPGAWAQCTTLVCSYSRTVYLRDYSGKIHMSRHQVLKTLHSSLSVRCDELHLVLLRSCGCISSCAQRLNAGRNQGHVKVVSGARNASFVHTVTVLTLCVSRTPRNSTSPQCSLRLAASRRHTSPRTARAERSAGVSPVSGSPPRAGSQTP